MNELAIHSQFFSLRLGLVTDLFLLRELRQIFQRQFTDFPPGRRLLDVRTLGGAVCHLEENVLIITCTFHLWTADTDSVAKVMSG